MIISFSTVDDIHKHYMKHQRSGQEERSDTLTILPMGGNNNNNNSKIN